MKIVYRAADITEAEIVKGMLLSSGIEAHSSGYYLQGGIGETSPMDLARVHVADEDYERAREVLRDYEGEQQVQGETPDEPTNSAYTSNLFVVVIVIVTVAVLSFWIGI